MSDMKKVSASEAENNFVIGQANCFPEKYATMLLKIKKMSKEEKLKISGQKEFEKTWNELFEDKETEWYKADLPPNTKFVNRVFDSGKGFMRSIGLKHSDLLKEYEERTKNEFRKRINEIRANLAERPRVIVLTKDFKEFSIFDGARRALAFILENKKIPCYIGKRKSFSTLKYLN